MTYKLKNMAFSGKRRFLGKIFRKGIQTIQVFLAFLFILLILYQWQQRKQFKTRLTQLLETRTIYRQMRNYSAKVCSSVNSLPKSKDFDIKVPFNIEIDMKKVSFVFISEPNLACVEVRIKELQKLYPTVKIILAFQSLDMTPKHYTASSFPSLKKVVNIGSFISYADAVKNAVPVVKTKYFMLLDSTLAIAEITDSFVETLMSNMYSFDLLGGSLLTSYNEFVIPCHSLQLKNWTLFEKYEYKASQNLMKCESTSPYFLADTDAFKAVVKYIDPSMGALWREDFFLHANELLKVGTLPEVIFKKSATKFCRVTESHFNTKKEIDSLLPFVNKHHVLNFINRDGNRTTICDGTDPMICSEKYVFPKWKLRHWAYSGLTAFPFIIKRLIDALRFGSAQLEKNEVPYVLEGGTLLGFIKIREVLPWDSGDVDTFVYSTRRTSINLVKQIEKQHGYDYLLRWNAFHVYVTPHLAAHDGLIVYAVRREDPGPLVKIRMHGQLFSAPRNMFKFIREYYGSSYLESRIRFGDERVSCDYEGHQACMPDCRWSGCGSGRQQFPAILT